MLLPVTVVAQDQSAVSGSLNGSVTDSTGAATLANNPDAAADNNKQNASGQSNADVPPQYKAGVSEYFRRVNDELSN